MQDKLEKINLILAKTDAEILELLNEKWRTGIINSPLYKVWDKKDKTEDQCIIEVLRSDLETLKGILDLFNKVG